MVSSSIVLIYLIIQAEIIRFLPKKQASKSKQMTTYNIQGMTCNHCVANVEKHLNQLENSTQVIVDLNSGKVQVEGEVSEKDIKRTIEQIGYRYEGKV
jgi:copper chaperone CopZ